MARKRYWAYALTGGTAGAMDTIDGASLSVGDICEVHNATTHATYYLTESGTAESSPNIIAPDTNAGDKRWEVAFPTFDTERGYFSDDATGANIYRFRDKVLIGDAADYDGKGTPAANSWLGDLGTGGTTEIWIEQNSTLSVIASRGIGISGAASSLDAPGAGGGSLGVVGFSINDGGDDTHNVWGGYFEAVRDTAGGQACGIEIDVTNLAASPNTTATNPYNTWVDGTTIGLSIASGGSSAVWGTSENTDVALEIHPNGSLFRTGIIFRNGALVRDSGANGPGHAILLAYDHLIEWYEYTTNTKAAYITSNITDSNHDQRLIFHNGGLSYRNGAGDTIFTMADNQNTVSNYLYVTGAEAGDPPILTVAGTDTNIDIRIQPKGTAYLRFGTWVSNADANITGYVYIKDIGGTLRKMATIA